MAAPFSISVRTDFEMLRAKLDSLGKSQIPFAASQAVNRLAKMALADLQQNERQVFDRPTPFTLRGFYARLGTKRDPHGEILARQFASKGTPAGKYLLPEALGGERHFKRFERALGFKTGELEFTVPGRGAPLDQYGNLSQGQINKILAALGAEGGLPGRRGRGGRTRKGDTYFIARSKKSGEIIGIWRVVSTGHVEPVLVFTHREPRYQVRFRFAEVVALSVQKNSAKVFAEELKKAIATAR